MRKPATNPMPEVNKRLCEAIHSDGRTYRKIAIDAGLDRAQIDYIVNCDGLPRLYTFARLCQTLNISADYILFGRENKHELGR